MVGRHFLLFFSDHHGAPFSTHQDLVLGALNILAVDFVLIGTCRQQSRLIDQIFQIGSREPGRTLSNDFQIDIFGQGNLAGMYLQDLGPATNIRKRHNHLAIETSGTQQRRIKNIRTVGGSNQDDPLVRFKTIHLNQQLVKSLFTLIVTAPHTSATMTTDGIYFIDEYDTGSVFLSLHKKITDPTGTNTDKHFNKIGTGDGEKRHPGFTGYRPAQQGFSGSRCTDQ